MFDFFYGSDSGLPYLKKANGLMLMVKPMFSTSRKMHRKV